MSRYAVSVTVTAIAAILVGCSTAGSSPSSPAGTTVNATQSALASASASAGEVSVTLREFSITPDVDTVAAGTVTFHVTNQGPKEVHEFVVIRTELEPGALPTGDDGAADEEGAGMQAVDEIEDLTVGGSQDLTVDLDAGSYVLICNIVDKGEAHYALGMRAAFTVE